MARLGWPIIVLAVNRETRQSNIQVAGLNIGQLGGCATSIGTNSFNPPKMVGVSSLLISLKRVSSTASSSTNTNYETKNKLKTTVDGNVHRYDKLVSATTAYN